MVHTDENDCVALALAVADQALRHRQTNQTPRVLHPETHSLARFRANGSRDRGSAEWPRRKDVHDPWDERFAFFARNATPIHKAHRLGEAAGSERGDVEQEFIGWDEVQRLPHERS